MTRILAVEDESDITAALRLVFERAGYEFVSSPDGRSGLRMMHELRPDLVVLDVGLPGLDGWAVLERIRDLADIPVLVLSAHSLASEKVRGLRAGADDYVTKPFANDELLARAEALLRRADRSGDSGVAWATVYSDRAVQINPKTRSVHVTSETGEREVYPTNTEFKLLNVLVRHADAVLSARQLLALVWDDPSGMGPERVKFAVLRLRRKLGWDTAHSPIRAVRGVGYRYVVPDAGYPAEKDTAEEVHS
jgi:DNA-binding response OmpR family regulator